jgi:hypothetical protein
MIYIWLNPEDNHWYATDDDPVVLELFGIDSLPTPWGFLTPLETVLYQLKKRNPNQIIEYCETRP